MIEWTLAHPYLTTVIILLSVHMPFKIVSRAFRMIMVCTRGWPTMPLMDADGDIVHPKKEEK